MFSYPLETLRSPAMAAYIEEWASPDFHKVMFLPLAILFFMLLGALALSSNRPRPSELFLLIVTGFGALRSARHIPIFALIAAPILARHVWTIMCVRGWDRKIMSPEAPAAAGAIAFTLIFLLAPATLGIVRVQHFVANQPAYEAKNYPVAAVNFLREKQLPGPLYNRYGWGGYLIRRLYPDYLVYIDGRADVYGDEFMVEAVHTYDGHPRWREPLDRLAIRTVLVSPDAALSSLLRQDQNWHKVYEDRQAVIFTREVNNFAAANKPQENSSQASLSTPASSLK
jgi:hypothetical protein